MKWWRVIGCWLVLLLAACAQQPRQSVTSPEVEACRARFAESEREIRAAGVRYPAAWPVPGAPFLRIDRFLASFQLDGLSEESSRQWLAAAAELDATARAIELRNLNRPVIAASDKPLAKCRERLTTVLQAKPSARAELGAHLAVPDEYRTWQRALGAYVLTRYAALRGVRDLQTRHAVSSEAPHEGGAHYALESGTDQVVSWQGLARDALGRPVLEPAQLTGLYREHAPRWVVRQESVADRIGALQWQGSRLVVDSTKPALYTYHTYTRFAGAVLLQLNYVVWFSARPATGAFDLYAGDLDGLTWRVTLDTDGIPLVFDVMHNCGCYHQWYPTSRLTRKAAASDELEEPLWLPLAITNVQRGAELTVHLAAGTHYLTAVTTGGHETSPIALRPLDYSVLFQLPTDTGTRSVFGDNGIVAQSARLERVVLWPLGVPAPGAMRSAGHHATAFIGRRHFDDAHLLERYFERSPSPLPSPAKRARVK